MIVRLSTLLVSVILMASTSVRLQTTWKVKKLILQDEIIYDGDPTSTVRYVLKQFPNIQSNTTDETYVLKIAMTLFRTIRSTKMTFGKNYMEHSPLKILDTCIFPEKKWMPISRYKDSVVVLCEDCRQTTFVLKTDKRKELVGQFYKDSLCINYIPNTAK